MSQGRPGDHPITDVLFHDSQYFNPEVRDLFKEVYLMAHKHLTVFDGINLYEDSNEVIHEKLLALKEELANRY